MRLNFDSLATPHFTVFIFRNILACISPSGNFSISYVIFDSFPIQASNLHITYSKLASCKLTVFTLQSASSILNIPKPSPLIFKEFYSLTMYGFSQCLYQDSLLATSLYLFLWNRVMIVMAVTFHSGSCWLLDSWASWGCCGVWTASLPHLCHFWLQLWGSLIYQKLRS